MPYDELVIETQDWRLASQQMAELGFDLPDSDPEEELVF